MALLWLLCSPLGSFVSSSSQMDAHSLQHSPTKNYSEHLSKVEDPRAKLDPWWTPGLLVSRVTRFVRSLSTSEMQHFEAVIPKDVF